MGLAEDLAADGAPEREHQPGIADRIARKRVAGGALIRDPAGRVLFVEPVYKPQFDIPGGMVERDESPLAACRREVREEIGLDLVVGALLVVDWIPDRGVWGDGLAFVFDGGTLPEETCAALRPTDPELRGLHFLHLADAADLVRPSMVRRLEQALAASVDQRTRYTEFGRLT